jgi:hypothetical protein
MKKTLVIIIVVLAFVCGMAAAAWIALPRVTAHLLGKALQGSVEASGSSVRLEGQTVVVRLEGVRMKGRIAGTVGSCQLRVQPLKGFYIEYLAISHFAVKVAGAPGGGLRFLPVPVERAEIRDGTVDYGGHKYVVREIRVANFNTGGQLEFSIDGGVEGLGDVKTKGEGYFGGKRSDIRGDYRLSRVNLSFLKDYEGLADSSGTFTYRGGKLVMEGAASAPYFSMWEKFLTRRLVSPDNDGHIHLEIEGITTRITLTGFSLDGTPLRLQFTVNGRKLVYLDLQTDFMPISEVTGYIDPALLSDGTGVLFPS